MKYTAIIEWQDEELECIGFYIEPDRGTQYAPPSESDWEHFKVLYKGVNVLHILPVETLIEIGKLVINEIENK